MKTINNALIRTFYPCYDPSEKVKNEDEDLPVLEWVAKYRGIVPDEDIVWLLCREEFMSEKDVRLFAVWCAREALKLVRNPDKRCVEACDTLERYINGEITLEELRAASYIIFIARKVAAHPSGVFEPTYAYRAYIAADYAAATAIEVSNKDWAFRHSAHAARAAAQTAAHTVNSDSDVRHEHEKQVNKLLTYF